MLDTFLRVELQPIQQDLLWLQQDWATAHTAQTVMQVLRIVFQGRLAYRSGKITWPARSPDLAVADHFLCGYVKSKVYETRPANAADLKQRVLECIQGIPKEMVQRVTTAFPSDCRSVLNDMVVAYRVTYSNNNDLDEFSWIWNAPDSINIFFPLCLKKLFHFKNRQVFLSHSVYYIYSHTPVTAVKSFPVKCDWRRWRSVRPTVWRKCIA